MALDIVERLEDSLERGRWRAVDSITGSSVAVTVSREALDDYTEENCLQKASAKYDGSMRAVDVTSADF